MYRCFTFIIALTVLFLFPSCKSKPEIEYIKHEVSFGNEAERGKSYLFRTINSYPADRSCSKENYASSFVCFHPEEKDTVIVIVRCESYTIKTDYFAGIFPNDQKDGESLNVAFKKNGAEEFSRYKKMYGTYKIPEE